MVWNGNEAMVVRRLSATMSMEQKRALCNELLAETPSSTSLMTSDEVEVLAPTTVNGWIRMIRNASHESREAIREIFEQLCSCGSTNCKGSCSRRQHASRLMDAECYNRRISELEENTLRANLADAIDIPAVAGAGGTTTVVVPAYNIPYYLQQFSMDGSVAVNTGSVGRVEVKIEHAGVTIVTFRVSQYYKATCCTTIADAFRAHNLKCLGSESTFSIVVTNTNELPGETFINGVFSYARGYPERVLAL